MSAPYYSDDHVTIYHGDCREILPTLRNADGSWLFDCIISDPPYGIGVQTNYRDRQRCALAVCNNYAPIHGDDEPFDPTRLLFMGVPMVLFGANHYADALPAQASWLAVRNRHWGTGPGWGKSPASSNAGDCMRCARRRRAVSPRDGTFRLVRPGAEARLRLPAKAETSDPFRRPRRRRSHPVYNRRDTLPGGLP